MRCTAGAAFGCTTETTGVLNVSVCVSRGACAFSRGRIPTPRASSTSTSGVNRISRALRGGGTFGTSALTFGSWALTFGSWAFIFGPSAFIFGSSAFMLLLPLIRGQRGHRGRMRLAALEPSVYRRKDDGHEQQGRHGSEQEPADHGAPQGSVLLAPVAETAGHRQHADQHCDRGHHHRENPPYAGADRASCRVAPMLHLY